MKDKLTTASLQRQLLQNCSPPCTMLQSRVTVDLRLVLVDVKRLPNPSAQPAYGHDLLPARLTNPSHEEKDDHGRVQQWQTLNTVLGE